MMPEGLYETDALAWSEHQAELLGRMAAGERLNGDVDWSNVIEEVHDVGSSQLRACNGLLRRAMLHLLKLKAWPGSQAARHWHQEAGNFLDDAAASFSPTMRQRIDLGELYGRALRRAASMTDDAGEANPLPQTCPFTLDALLAGDVAQLLAALDGPPA